MVVPLVFKRGARGGEAGGKDVGPPGSQNLPALGWVLGFVHWEFLGGNLLDPKWTNPPTFGNELERWELYMPYDSCIVMPLINLPLGYVSCC